MALSKRLAPMDNRKKKILHTTINHYIDTAEPVGSAVLSQKMGLNLSPATLRNELSELEKEGYLTHVHTSSGRVPTDLGYRSYVDSMGDLAFEPLSVKSHIECVGRTIQDVLSHISDMMVSLVDYTTIILTPDIYQESLKVAHLVLLDLDKVLVVLLNSAGVNSEFLLTIEEKVNQDDLNRISQLLTRKLEGKSAENVDAQFVQDIVQELPLYEALMTNLCSQIKHLSKSHRENRHIMTKGMSKMLKLPEFHNIELTQKVMATLEENKVLLAILSQYLEGNVSQVVIGQESKIETLKDCSLVLAPYGVEAGSAGLVGVLGPRRMPYSQLVPMVQKVSEKISGYLGERQLKEVL